MINPKRSFREAPIDRRIIEASTHLYFQGKAASAVEVAEELGMDYRRVARRRNFLMECGVPILHRNAQGSSKELQEILEHAHQTLRVEIERRREDYERALDEVSGG